MWHLHYQKTNKMKKISRREFLTTAALMAGAASVATVGWTMKQNRVPVYGHLWVYASKYPPDWDCTPILGKVFEDFKYAGIEGVEVMEAVLRNPRILSVGKELIEQHKLPITGTSYYGDMWRKDEHERIYEDVDFVVDRLHQLGGTMFGITVGDAKRKKTEAEMDAQADLLLRIIKICDKYSVEPNIHNHTFEVAYDLHDMKGIIKRIPEIKLGPDISWLKRAGVDPVNFIKTYGQRIVYLHLRDQGSDNLFTEAVGEGTIDFSGIAAELRRLNYQGKAAIELAYEKPAQRQERENWKISRDYVRKVFKW
jgi:sugar phosphate isomerase/epimerase